MKKITSVHKVSNQPTSQKKLKLLLQGLFRKDSKRDVISVLHALTSAAAIKKTAHLLLRAVMQCIHNIKNECKQKNLEIHGNGEVEIKIGKGSCFKRMTYRAKGSRSDIIKHRANITISITNDVAMKTQVEKEVLING